MSYIGQGLPADTFQGFTTDKFTGDGTANKAFTLTKEPFSEDTILVTIDGVVQEPTDDFTVSGTTLTLVGTAPNNSEVNVTHMGGPLPIGGAAELDLNGASDKLVLDADGDSTISADTDDQIDFKAGNADTMHVFNGDVRINTTTAIQPGSSGGLGVKGDINISDFTNDTSSSALVFTKSRNTTPGSQTIVNNDDQVGAIFFKADDGDASDYNNNVAAITATVDAAPGTNDTPGRLAFFTTNDGERANTERARITSGGYFKASNDTDYYAVSSSFHEFNNDAQNDQILTLTHHRTANQYGLFIKFNDGAPDNTTQWFIACHDNAAARFEVKTDGDVINHDNSYGQVSDERIKENITNANSQWDDLKNIRVVNFERKDDIAQYGNGKKVQIGVIAQEIEKVSPGLVKEEEPSANDIKMSSEFGTLYEDGDTIPEDKNIGDIKTTTGEKVKKVSYSVLYMKAIKALQEAMAKIETLETKVKALEDA